MSLPYRTLFVGTLVQESFLSAGGRDDPDTTVDSPFCRDGLGWPTLRGTGLAGALIATLRRLNSVPPSISGSKDGRQPSVWRFFNSHPEAKSETSETRWEACKTRPEVAYRQHVAIDHRTGAAATGALFNVETLPPGTHWPFLLEVDTSRDPEAAGHARKALAHWAAGRCLIGREVARGLGWMTLRDLKEYALTTDQIDIWPNAERAERYLGYIQDCFALLGKCVPTATEALPGWLEIRGTISAGEHDDGYGIDSLSIGGHASEELAAQWDDRFFAPEGMTAEVAKQSFDPDFAVVTWVKEDVRVPYIPGSSLRGPLRHALARLLKARGQDATLVKNLFGTGDRSAKLLIRDALPDSGHEIQLAWLQHHAEDEFTGGAFSTAKFDRVAVMHGRFGWKMVLEDATEIEKKALFELFELARAGQIGIGGGQWRGHGWLHWEIEDWDKPKPEESHA